MTEAQEQTALIKWSQQPKVRTAYPELKLLFHIPNGGRRDAVEARHLKAMGVKAGVPDLFLPVPSGHYHGLWIEMKSEKGRTRSEQDWWLAELSKQGYAACVCHGWKEAAGTIRGYLEDVGMGTPGDAGRGDAEGTGPV